MRRLSIGFLLPYGELSDSFFPDTLLAALAAQARAAGHEVALARVYYDGRDRGRDAEVARRLEAWLGAHSVELVVLARLFDPAPIARHLAGAPTRRCALITLGDSFEPEAALDLVVGGSTGNARSGTRRTPAAADLALAFERLVAAIADGTPAIAVPGVTELRDGVRRDGPPIERATARRAYDAVVDDEVIALGPAPAVTRKTLFGNAGCPFGDDPTANRHYAGVTLPAALPVARLGCAFCCLGGDYEKRPSEEVIADLVEQARFWTSRVPTVRELVLADQQPLPYLGTLVDAAAQAGVPPVRWLFAARADGFVRQRGAVERAIAAAARRGHALEVYLTGFEAFSDVELERYNKGTTVAEQLAAIGVMRELAARHPRTFGYAEARGHSLILWNPWTRPEELRQSLDVIRAHGLGELFFELGKNRLRLYPDLPIFYAAARDGALVDAWVDGDEGAARQKGYNVEHPWRFLDERTRLAYELARGLRERLGAESELAQLHAVAAHTARLSPAGLDVGTARARVFDGLAALEAAMAPLLRARAADAPPRGRQETARVVRFAGACNNGCRGCANGDRFAADDVAALRARIDAARAKAGAIVLAGREPTLHPAFVELVAHARGDDGRRVAVVTNGRRFAYAAFAHAAARAGLRAASVKLFAADAAVADAISADDGGHAQALRGIRALQLAGVAVELRAPLYAANLARLDELAPLARALGAQLRIEVALDAVGLDRLHEAAAAVRRLTARCASEGVALEAAPTSASTLQLDRVPSPPTAKRPAERRPW